MLTAALCLVAGGQSQPNETSRYDEAVASCVAQAQSLIASGDFCDCSKCKYVDT